MIRILFILLGLSFSYSAYAWNALGHMVVADIAYQHLTPRARSHVDRVVANFSQEYPKISDFNKMASWADMLRFQDIQMFTHWHYINIFFSNDNTPLKKDVDNHHVVWAIHQINDLLASNHLNRFEQARFLAFLVHFVADIHQPLHTVSRISAHYPDGDEGGNKYFIHYSYHNIKIVKLHTLVDGGFTLLAMRPTSQNVDSLSHLITTQYPKKYFADKVDNLLPEDWADEGFKMATQFIYSTPENGVPSDAYIQSGKIIAEKRLALAGYRLANILNKLFDNKKRYTIY